jgi:hypothetical protein
MQLTSDQIVAVRKGEAVRVDESGLECVLVRADVYDRLKHLVFDDSEWSDDELRRMLARSADENGWNEVGMDAYDRYDEEMQKRCP